MNDFDDAIGRSGGAPRAAGSVARAPAYFRFTRKLVLGHLAGLRRGRLRIQDAEGSATCGASADAEPDVTMRISDTSAYADILTGGAIGAAESYMAGKWTVSDLTALVRLFIRNRSVLDRLETGLARAGKPLLRLAHWRHRNSVPGSRRNIAAHYDLGNELFELFLDPTMMYSSAVWPHPEARLEEAAVHKLELICRKLELSPADHLLEIGTGWGGLAIHAARRFGCRVTTTTISKQQFEFATRRVREAGLDDRITVVCKDYRDLRGQFDKLVSVEMIEAVGHRFLDTYFRACSERLKPAGRMLLQAIVMADRNHEHSKRSVDFIQTYIFPGGALPSMGSILASISRMTDLQITGLHDIGLDYARTLSAWRERFLDRLADVRRLGYPEEFVRMWEWYLAYCEGGFMERAISTVQVVFDKPDSRLPAPVTATGATT